MPFNILEAVAYIQKSDLARISDFQVMIFGPTTVGQSLGDEQGLSFMCSAIEFPGRTISTIPHKHYGPLQNIGYEQTFSDVSLTLMLTDTFEEKLFFERWQDFVVGTSRTTQQVTAGMFDIGYYHDYVGAVIITQYDRSGEPVYTSELVEAYPVAITNLNADWAETEISKLNVTFTYRYAISEDGYWNEPLGLVRNPQI